MKLFFSFTCIFAIFEFSFANFQCHDLIDNFEKDYSKTVCYKKSCAKKIQQHIKEELYASFHYLYNAAYFEQESVNRPGLAKFLYASASEERQHAMMMLDYLNYRGIPNTEDFLLKMEPKVPKPISYKTALTTALNLEIDVTQHIYKIIKECEDDYHAADKFTEPILGEQHEGIRQLQGMIKEFDNLVLNTTDLQQLKFAEYIFDLKLLEVKI